MFLFTGLNCFEAKLAKEFFVLFGSVAKTVLVFEFNQQQRFLIFLEQFGFGMLDECSSNSMFATKWESVEQVQLDGRLSSVFFWWFYDLPASVQQIFDYNILECIESQHLIVGLNRSGRWLRLRMLIRT
jgi:hypothetical protein